MKLFKKIPVRFEDKEFEIRVLYDEAIITVVAFWGNHPANGFRYQIRLPKRYNALEVLNQNIPRKYIEIAKDDLIERRWKKYLERYNKTY